MYILNSKQMYEAECSAVGRGITFSRLMENAGTECADIIFNTYCSDAGKKILVLCGKGKNGGDGFVIARVLWEKGCDVTVILTNGEPTDEISLENYLLLSSAGIKAIDYVNINDIIFLINNTEIIVDAVFGTGFRGKPDAAFSMLAQVVNNSSATLISVDVPSGTNCNDAVVEGSSFIPDVTIAISSLKPIHVIKPYCSICGKIIIADIGITEDDYKSIKSPILFNLEFNAVKKLFPKRKPVSNKGTYGHALCICGSMRMVGAAELSVKAALRCGAGLVTAAFPQAAYQGLAPKFTENLLLPLDSNLDGTFSAKAYAGLADALSHSTAVLIGCGLGYNIDTARLVENVLRDVAVPVVIDADALNILSKNPDTIKDIKPPVIVTPHPGEMSRLTGKTVQEILFNPYECASDFSDRYGCITVLKGANTVICEPGSKYIYVNGTGNSGLSKGGSGDLLSGIIVSLLAQGMKPADAARCAVYIHGDCADDLAKENSERSMLPSDIINHLPGYFSERDL